MKQKLTPFPVAVALIALMAGCASTPEQGQSNLAPAKDPHEAAQRIVQAADSYCKGEADKYGADFVACFKQRTDTPIEQLVAQSAAKGEPFEANSTQPVISMRAIDVEGHSVTLVDSKQLVNGVTIACEGRVERVDRAVNPLGQIIGVSLVTDCSTQ